MNDAMIAPWTVLVPVKSTLVGKSRLGLESGLRRSVALALARDTVTAIATARQVHQVFVAVETKDDAAILGQISGVAPYVVRARGLNEALTEALSSWTAAEVGRATVAADGYSHPVAIVPADLPSVTADEIDEALRRATQVPVAVVADRQGIGTTMLAALRPESLVPRFGGNSLAAHLSAGATLIDLPVTSGLRRDVDALEDLQDVTGAITRATMERLGLAVSCG